MKVISRVVPVVGAYIENEVVMRRHQHIQVRRLAKAGETDALSSIGHAEGTSAAARPLPVRASPVGVALPFLSREFTSTNSCGTTMRASITVTTAVGASPIYRDSVNGCAQAVA